MNSIRPPAIVHGLATCLLLALFRLAVTTSLSQSNGVNVTGDTANGSLAPGEVAGVAPYAQSSWNNVSVFFTPVGGLIDNQGAPTPVTAEARGFLFTSGGPAGSPDLTLMRNYIAAAGPGTGIVLRGIQYSLYDLIVYFNGSSYGANPGDLFYDVPDFNSTITASGSFRPLQLAATFSGTYAEATATSAGNYYRIHNLSYPSIGVGSISVNFSAIQIVAVPEPTSHILLLAGLLLFAAVHAAYKGRIVRS